MARRNSEGTTLGWSRSAQNSPARFGCWRGSIRVRAGPRGNAGFFEVVRLFDWSTAVICFWCHIESRDLTDDHIIPYSLGGTKDWSVRAYASCQNRLSKAEHEVARKSMLAIHALAAPVAPRHPDRPTSGHLRPTYFMVKHPHGGYGETLLSAGEQVSLLPYFEIKVMPGEPLEGRVRGSTEDVRRLLDVFRKGLRSTPSPNQFLFEVKVSCDLDPTTADDVNFWPRIVLLPGDRLSFRRTSDCDSIIFE